MCVSLYQNQRFKKERERKKEKGKEKLNTPVIERMNAADFR